MQLSQKVLLRSERVSFAPSIFTSKRTRAIAPPSSAPLLLRDISFEVSPGDRIAIVGPSGAGKTLLLRMLNRLSEPTEGALYLNEQPFLQLPVTRLREQVVLVLQESKLLGMTVKQALEYPLILRQLPKQTIQARIESWLERLHIPSDWLSRTELQLSVGQRQLVAIARALVTQPTVLLLDEPTSALDVGRSYHVLQVLTELAQSQEITILMTNHQLDLAKQFCNRVFYLQNGTLIQDSSVEAMNWEQLQHSLIHAETQQAQEWE